MELGILWSGLICVAPLQFIEVLRMIFGPLPTSLCWFQSFWRNCPMTGAMVYFVLTVIFRYIFIFVYKSVPPINEDFISRVIYLSVSLCSLLYGIVFMVIPGQMAVNFYMCTGQDPRVDFYTFKKVIRGEASGAQSHLSHVRCN